MTNISDNIIIIVNDKLDQIDCLTLRLKQIRATIIFRMRKEKEFKFGKEVLLVKSTVFKSPIEKDGIKLFLIDMHFLNNYYSYTLLHLL